MIQLPGDVLFDSGRDELKKDGKDILLKVAEVIRNDKDLERALLPGRRSHRQQAARRRAFKDNWGLSVMRAREVLTFLVTSGGAKARRRRLDGRSLERGRLRRHRSRSRATTRPRTCRRTGASSSSFMPNVEEMLDLKSLTQIALARRRDRHRHELRPPAHRRGGRRRRARADRRARRRSRGSDRASTGRARSRPRRSSERSPASPTTRPRSHGARRRRASTSSARARCATRRRRAGAPSSIERGRFSAWHPRVISGRGRSVAHVRGRTSRLGCSRAT